MGDFRYLVWFAIIFVVCFVISAARKKPINAGKWGFIIMAVLAIAESVFACSLVAQRPDLTPAQRGEFVGRQGGSAVIPLVIAGVLWYRFKKRHSELEPNETTIDVPDDKA